MTNQDRNFEWKVAEDRLSVLVLVPSVDEDNGDSESLPVPSVEEVCRALEENGVTAVVDRDTLENALNNPSDDWVVIAKGVPPVPPNDARLEYLINLDLFSRPLSTSEDEKVDYKNLNLIVNVTKGQELVRKHDPVLGEPGLDVYGQEVVPAEPRDLDIPIGEGVEITEEGHLAIATDDGAITAKKPKKFMGRQGKEVVEIFNENSADGDDTQVRSFRSIRELSVTKYYKVSDDISYKTGNIEFNGTVEIVGNVLTGFEVHAANDIIVKGLVEGARLNAGGSIIISGGVQGQRKAHLRAGENINVRFAGEATLEAGSDILVRTHLLNCQVFAGQNVRLEATKGLIAGGDVRAGKSIEAAYLGTELGVKTLVQIGLDSDIIQKIVDKEQEIEDETKKMADILEILSRLQALKEKTGSLSPEHEKVRIRAVQNQYGLMGGLEAANRDLEKFKSERDRGRKGCIKVGNTAHSGVVVRFPGAAQPVDHSIRFMTFYYEKGEIRSRAN